MTYFIKVSPDFIINALQVIHAEYSPPVEKAGASLELEFAVEESTINMDTVNAVRPYQLILKGAEAENTWAALLALAEGGAQ